MTTAQVFQQSIRTTFLGMGLVLGTLFVLSLILDLMRVVFAPRKTVKKNEVVTHDEMIEETQNTEEQDDTELVAVITAALIQYMGGSLSTLKIGTIRQIHTKTPTWGMASRIYSTNNKL